MVRSEKALLGALGVFRLAARRNSRSLSQSLRRSGEKNDKLSQKELELQQIDRWLTIINNHPSSAIAAVDYNYDKKTLTLMWTSGGSYEYLGVRPKDVQSMAFTSSLGRWSNNFKRFHEFRRLGGAVMSGYPKPRRVGTTIY